MNNLNCFPTLTGDRTDIVFLTKLLNEAMVDHVNFNLLNVPLLGPQAIIYMITLAKKLPEFNILLSIPSIAENTAVRLISELWDVQRFERSQLHSFIGLYLTGIQSGDYIAQHHQAQKLTRPQTFILDRRIHD